MLVCLCVLYYHFNLINGDVQNMIFEKEPHGISMLLYSFYLYTISLCEKMEFYTSLMIIKKGSENMNKKIFSLILVALICCSTVIAVFIQAEHSRAAQNDVSNGNEEPAITDVTSHSSEIVTEEREIVINPDYVDVINPDYVYTVKMDPDYLEWYLGAPDEILSASTSELLEYFLESPFMGQSVLSVASTSSQIREHDFSCHEAFRELVSREDCVEALETYAGSILYSSETNELDRAMFEKLLVQPLVKSVISDFLSAAASCPNLRSIYTTLESDAS